MSAMTPSTTTRAASSPAPFAHEDTGLTPDLTTRIRALAELEALGRAAREGWR
jgi:hypothetical protein